MILTCQQVFAQSGDGGATGLAFLKFGAGARAAGLGNAFTALSDDATASYWNPAGLSAIRRTRLAFTHTEWLQDISNDFLAVAFPAFSGGVGLSVFSNQVDGIERRDIPSVEPIGTVDANDIAASLSYARTLSDRLSAGVTLKYLYEKIYLESASGYAFDFGLRFQSGSLPVAAALVLQNVGAMNDLQSESIRLPTTLRAGLAYQVDLMTIDGTLSLVADAIKVRDAEWRAGFGAEVAVKQHFSLRLGYQTGFDDKSVSGGFGLHVSRYNVDYGYTPFSSGFGDTHRFSFGLDL